MARGHRIGQKSHVSVYHFVSKDTMEEYVLERAKKKIVLEYASEWTRRKHTTAKNASKPNDLSKEELHAVLKYGAQKIMAANKEGTSLGGEGLLAQFASVSDVNNDMAWEDIIPDG
ncbi:hypothetical protein EIP86_008136 [Pleurotus ostreatoroseus]|nr:hypothetical protein EIP86_008136 [Pleurotus ostreatoroseus]